MKQPMNKIQQLIQQLCPEGVEYRKLEEVVNLTMGTSPSGDTFSSNVNEGIEFHQGKSFFGNEIINHSNIYTTKPIKIADTNSIIMSVRAPVGDTNITNREIAIGRGLCSMTGKDNLSTKFLYYFINENIQLFKNKSSGSTFESINTQEIKSILIPIPPLPIQHEIVNILDKFTRLEAELEAELEARKKQYEYYRNQLLCFEGKEVEWKTLGEVGEFVRGNGLQKKDFTYNGVGCIHYGQIHTFYGTYTNTTKSFVSETQAKKLKKASKNDLVMATVSEDAEGVCKTVAWLGDDDICVSGDALIFKHKENAKFLSYYFQTQMFIGYKKRNASGTKVIRVHSDKLKKLSIPIPPLSEQNRIVEILDRFDALVNDISIGLPAEIEARRKQYEYYRGKLLNFSPITANQNE